MLSKDEHENLLKAIADSGGDTANMLDLMQKLRDDYDEREGMLAKYGETRDGEDAEGKDEERTEGETKVDWRAKYDDLEKRYKERFFTTREEVKEEQTEDIKEDGKEYEYEKLFEEREG